MPNTNDLVETPIPRILLVGDSGTHKTYFLATIPEVYVFDFDKGMAIARGMGVEYDTFKDAPRGGRTNKEEGIYSHGNAWSKFLARLNYIGSLIDKGEWDRPLALDSITTLSNSAMAYVLSNAGHTDMPQIQHWGAQMQLLEMVMEQLSSWPIPIVVTAHIQRNTNDLTQVIEYLPLVTGKLAGKLALYFDEVYYTQVKGKGDEKEFTLQTESDAMHKQAKTRYGVPDGTPTHWDNVIETINQPVEDYGKKKKKKALASKK